ncbi:restriction endonuclease subunit S [Kaistella daneshvariae]|nr:restriction endonuclease subunit S [Kaistella daneshvariae]
MTNWKEYKLSDLMQIKYGKDHKHLADGPYPLYGSGGVMRYVEKPLYEEESILIPRKGTLSNLFYLNTPFWSVDTMFYSRLIKSWLYQNIFFILLRPLI